MDCSSLVGLKFDSCHQFAVLLTQHLGPQQALDVCRENGWDGVRRALEVQSEMVTRVASGRVN
ncbi:MAG: hypothetical protein FJX36_00960 [Alphaproteobacteria bacterium]|nr:hypothetical protein [Alphaproteobacteria bacterium]